MVRKTYRCCVTLSILCCALTLITGPALVLGENVDDGVTFSSQDWPWWRGPDRNGVAPAGQDPPLEWSDSKNIVWSLKIVGRGHGSPTVVGERIFLAVADTQSERQGVICVDRQSGKLRWHTNVHQSGLATKGNSKSTQASSTIACDGERIFINFLNRDAIYTTALTLDGKQLWQQKVTDYVVHQGYGSSPAVYQDLVLVSADNKGGGVLAGLDRKSGDVIWKRDRPEKPNYASPIVVHVDGRDQVIFIGCDLVTSLDPRTGDQLWEVEGATTECVTSTVTDGKLIFTSGGYPKNHISAVSADGTGKTIWESKTRMYVPSMLAVNDHLFATGDAGIAMCIDNQSGREVWKHRIGGAFTASPVLVGDRIYATDESGKTTIFKASSQSFQLLGENQLGDETFATPTICGGRIYTRVGVLVGDKRQEVLYCIGRPSSP